MTQFKISQFKFTQFDFNEIACDNNNPQEIQFLEITCPKCQTVHKNIGIYDFTIENDDFIDLFMVDNDLSDLDSIIYCNSCKRFFLIDFSQSTENILIVKLMQSIKK